VGRRRCGGAVIVANDLIFRGGCRRCGGAVIVANDLIFRLRLSSIVIDDDVGRRALWLKSGLVSFVSFVNSRALRLRSGIRQ
jgi:hypothetical protein